MTKKKLLLMCVLVVLNVGVGSANVVKMEAQLGHPVMLAGLKQTAYLRIALTGLPPAELLERAPVNVAIVLDKSGSMQGEKIQQAKEAAIMAIEMLNERDIVSFVTYDSTVNVVVPATKITDKEEIFSQIRAISAGGNTALFGGISKGAAEIRKFLSNELVNRIILISDGLANVGPSSPEELGNFGMSLGKDGITVTTIGLGLGYNEDLMAKLAYNSDGKHLFAETASDIRKWFAKEFGDVLSVVAQEVTIEINCAKGIRPVRSLGRDTEIIGQKVLLTLNQVYGNQMKYLVLEVEVPATAKGKSREIADVRVSYTNMGTKLQERLRSTVTATFTDSKELVKSSGNKKVLAAAARQVASEKSELAMSLRDEGKIEEAKKVLHSNTLYLKEKAGEYESVWLEKDAASNARQAENLAPGKWEAERKRSKQDVMSQQVQDWYIE